MSNMMNSFLTGKSASVAVPRSSADPSRSEGAQLTLPGNPISIGGGIYIAQSWIPDDSRKELRLAAFKRRAQVLGSKERVKQAAKDEAKKVAETKERVPLLVAEVFPKLTVPLTPLVELLGAGSYNRVFCVTIDSSPSGGNSVAKTVSRVFVAQPKQECVLRVSKEMGGFCLEDEQASLACLDVVAARVSFPVPKVFSFSHSLDNALGAPYTVQNRIRGQDLAHSDMSFAQKASLIPQLCKIIEEMATVTSLAAGAISSENFILPNIKAIALTQFSVPNPRAAVNQEELDAARNIPSHHQTPLEYLLDHAQRWYDYERAKGETARLTLWLQFKVIARSLDRLDFLGDHFHLSHEDFFPRNIMVASRGLWAADITGVIDWDMAVFAPKFVTLAPPTWAWSDLKPRRWGSGDEGSPEKPDPTKFSVPLRDLFRRVASPELRKFATSFECHLAREMWDALMTGMQTPKRMAVAFDAVQAWGVLHPEDRVELELCNTVPL
ncbi:hypothetical protein NX059_004175 [Plenodomus lindquistii]|nr:hypothetical protein NX059_004175 [Plenodomus lindquistii]